MRPIGVSGSRLARFYGSALALVAGFAVVATEPVLASVGVQTKRISRSSPFVRGSQCTLPFDPGFSRGFAQETSVAVNPQNPNNILVDWIQDGRMTDTVMASKNGGRTFSRVFVPGLTACTGGNWDAASDPGVAFTADGRQAYFTAIVIDNPSDPEEAVTGMFVARSFDGGFSWPIPHMVQKPTGQFWDLPRITPDPRQPNVAYYVYDRRKPPDFNHGFSVFSKTTDGGRTWSPAQKLYDPHTTDSWPAINKILVMDDGSLLYLTAIVDITADPSEPNGTRVQTKELALRSTDGGETWGPPINIGRSSGKGVIDPVSHRFMNIYDTYPSQTIAPNGDVYFSFLRAGTHNTATHASAQIVVARSTDGGRHWTKHRLAINRQAALPTVEVAGDGTVGVLYYVVAPSSSAGFWPARVSVATSSDHGRHWARHQVAGPFNLLTMGNKSRECCFPGDYLGSARVPHGMVFAYPMAKPVARNKVDAYFTRVTTSR